VLTFGDMSRAFRISLAVLIPIACVTLVLCAGITNVYGTGALLQANVGGWLPDGAPGDSFWDASMVDVPGLSVYAGHCRGRMRFDLQVGATGPSHSNPCYAAMSMYGGGGGQSETYFIVPGGRTALYRDSVNHGPWNYGIGNVIYYSSPPVPPGQALIQFGFEGGITHGSAPGS